RPLLNTAESGRLSALAPVVVPDDDAVEPPFVGRAKEFAHLAGSWRDAEVGRPRSVLVIGQAGIGKTRLCDQLLRYAAIRGGKVFAARCYAAERRVALNPLAEALKTGLDAGDIEHLPATWRTVLESYFPDVVTPTAVPHDIELMRDVPVPRRLQEAVARLFVALSAEQPIVLFLDDVQWADESTTAVLHYLSRVGGEHRLMLIAALRTDDLTDSPAHALLSDRDDKTRWVSVEIGEMEQPDAETLIARFAPKLEIEADSSLIRDVYELAGGLPLFVVQVMRAGFRRRMKDGSTQNVEKWSATAPKSLQRFVRGQLQRLSADARALLSCMAVVGEPIRSEKLIVLSDLTADAFGRALENLEAETVVKERQGAISMTHGVIRDIVAELVPPSTSRRLHRQVAALLERDGQHGRAAVHYEIAADRAGTLRTALVASKQSEKLLAFDEAVYFLKMARSVVSNPAEIAGIDEDLARILLRERWYAEADGYLENLEHYYRDRPEDEARHLRIRSERAIARSHRTVGALTDRIEELTSLLEEAREKGQTIVALKLLRDLGVVAFQDQIAGLAISVAHELIDHTSNVEDKRAAVSAYVAGIVLISHFESVHLAKDLLSRLDTFQEHHGPQDPFVEGSVQRCRAQVYQQIGDLEAAQEAYHHVKKIAEKYALGPVWNSVGNNIAVIDMERGEYASAIDKLNNTMTYVSPREYIDIIIACYHNLAICHWEIRRYNEMARAAKDLASLHEKLALTNRRHEAWSMLGLAALHLGNLTEAKNCQREILFWEGAEPMWYGDTSYREMFLARLAELEGREAEAMERIAAGIEAYKERDFFCRSRLQLEWARLAVKTKPEEAAAVAREVREAARQNGAVPLVENADRILDRVAAHRDDAQ
ncbi:MAG TPA: AAA family ATPase, partial [Longimicrobiales bacterium]|nr:AAA family ATPase [Longimicrobiales bacterium]